MEYRGGPGATTEMHSHPDLIAYPLTPGHFRFTLDNGQTFELDLPVGEPVFVDAQNHSTENLGSNDVHVLLIELK